MSQDDWKRITLRIPHELHAKLVEAGELSSVNAEIVTRLQKSFEPVSDEEQFGAYRESRGLLERELQLLHEMVSAMLERDLGLSKERREAIRRDLEMSSRDKATLPPVKG